MIEINKLYNEDCKITMSNMDDNFVDLIVTSPPYYNMKSYSQWKSYQSYLDWLKDIFNDSYRIIKPGRMCAVNISTIIEQRIDRSHESRRIALPFHFVNIMESIGFKFIEDIIWVKPEGSAKNRNGGFFRHRQPVAYKPNVINEYIFIFQKPMDGLIDKIVRGYKGDVRENSLVKSDYERSNVWYINPETRSKHPAPFPMGLSNRIIKYYSYEGDLVYDPFSGSGTTIKSAIKLNRNYIGSELCKQYFDLSIGNIV